MNIREGASRKVSFDTREDLGDKIDKLTVMIGKLAAKDGNRYRPFKQQIHKVEDLHHQVRTEVTVIEVIKIGPD